MAEGCRQVAAYSEVPGGDPNSASNCPRRPRRIGAKNGVPPANRRLLGAGTEFWHPTRVLRRGRTRGGGGRLPSSVTRARLAHGNLGHEGNSRRGRHPRRTLGLLVLLGREPLRTRACQHTVRCTTRSLHV